MTLKISRIQVSTQPKPTHQNLKKNSDPTQPNPWMDPTRDQLWFNAILLHESFESDVDPDL